jgi:hypothetical protein
MNKTVIGGAIFLMLAGVAQAQTFGGDTVVDGNVNAQVYQGASIVFAAGVDDTVTSLQSSVTQGSAVHGNFSATSMSGLDAAVVLGAGSTARNTIASVDGATVNGSASLHAYTGGVVTMALGDGASACTSIASVRRSTGSYSATVVTGGVVNIGIGTIWPGRVSIGSIGSTC